MDAEGARSLKARGLEWISVVLLVGLVTLPFLDKPFHIDDVIFLRVTENVVADPVNPYAGQIDWWDRPFPIWHLDSNPPFLNYYLAPFAAASDSSELVLHLAMIPFFLLFAAAMLFLARRFTSHPWWALLFVMASAGVVVSGNVMRDIPAAALGTAAVAAVVAGTDRNDRVLLLLGSSLAGLAALTKYSAFVLLLMVVLYPPLKGKPRLLAWAGIPAAMFAGWCLHNQLVYGELHILAQLGRGYTRPGHAWRDNLCGLPVVAGSLLYLVPALLARSVASRDRWVVGGAFAVVLATWWLVQQYMSGAADAQYLLWSSMGCALLFVCSAQGARGALPLLRGDRGADSSDSLFLLAWLLGPLAFATIFVPFQAVRHLIPALPPLVLLAFRYLESRGGVATTLERAALGSLLVVQAVIALLVARADADFAETYRDFAGSARDRIEAHHGGRSAEEGGSVWFLGHWGWIHYAEKAGLRKLHTIGPYPENGDFLIVPTYVDKGLVLERSPRVAVSLQRVDAIIYPGRIPIRTMHPSGAGFYALFSKPRPGRPPRVPYRFEAAAPLEIFEVHEVRY
jgi:hypothetical protein